MKLASLVAFAALCTAVPAAAQEGSPLDRGSTRGLGLGVSFNQSKVGLGRYSPGGAGVGLAASYGVNEALSFFVRGNYGYQNAQLGAGARYSFRGPGATLRPYLEIGGTHVRTREESTVEQVVRSSGYAATAGAGVEYFITPKLALDVGIVHSEGRFTHTEVGGTAIDSNRRLVSNGVNIGFRWRP